MDDDTGSRLGTVTVDRVPPELTHPLRQRVLRPGLPPSATRFAVEADPRTATFAARDAAGTVVGAALTFPVDCPWIAGRAAWRLRGMATAPELRSHGIGSRVLDRVVAHVLAEGGDLLWCHARTPARRFYERAGFVAHGEPWDEPDIGPHIAMARDLRSVDGPGAA